MNLVLWIPLFLGIGLLWLGLHPFTTYPLSLMLLHAWRHRPPRLPPAAETGQTFALCCCAYNEEEVIAAKLDNCLALRRTHPDLRILFYVDAATDRTVELLRGSAITLYVAPERAGKTHGMNQLTALIDRSVSVLVFTDANVMLDSGALTRLERYFALAEIGCVCGHLRYTNAQAGATAGLGALYWRFEEWVKQLETDTGSTMGADGSLFAIRRSLSRRVPENLIDDMFVSLSILCDGHRVVRAADVSAYELASTSPGEEFRRKARIACQALNVHRRLWPRLRRLDRLTVYKYVSHKLMRWFSGISLALGGLCLGLAAVAAGFLQVAVAVLLSVVAVALLGWKGWGRLPSHFWGVVIALAGTALGVWYSMRGADFQIWTPPQSARGGADRT